MTQADAQRIADAIVDGQWRHDRNTRWAAAIGVIMLALLMIAVVTALVGTETKGRPFSGSSTDQAHVVFTSRPPQPGPSVVMHIGTALITGNHAEVAYDVNCGQVCGHGETAIFTKLGGAWVRTGTGEGYRWIS